MTEYRVGSLKIAKAGEPQMTSIGERDVALFMCRGKVVATSGQCPHNEGPLSEGEVDGTVLTCPWHGWQFDLVTGECLEDDTIFLERFPVRIDGDDIMVML